MRKSENKIGGKEKKMRKWENESERAFCGAGRGPSEDN